MRVYQYLIILLIALGTAVNSYAQDDPTNRQYLFNLLNINPAYAGTGDGTSVTAAFRKQWAGIPGAPQTGIFSIDGPLKEHHFGVGFQLYSNTLGKERTTGVNMSFATQLKFDDEQFLSLGLQAGLMNYRIDRTSVALPYQNDVAFQTNTNVVMPTAGAGIYYQNQGFYVSLSAPSLLVSTVKVDKIISIYSPALSNLQTIFTAGATATLSDELQIRPSIYLRYMSATAFDVHVNSTIWYKDLIGIGASYRYDDAVLGIIQLKVSDKLSFGYSYGQSIGDKGVFSQGTHELLIRLNLKSSEQ